MNKLKTLSYCSFMITGLLVTLVFVSATTYIMLAVGILLYIPLAYLMFKVFPRKKKVTYPKKTVAVSTRALTKSVERLEPEPVGSHKEGWGIADIDKRVFLKLIGGAGLALFLFSIFNKKGESQFFGKAAGGSGTVTLADTAGKKIDPVQSQPTDGYRISEVDDNIISFYGFTNKDGAWFIMREDADTGSFRYNRGDSNFPGNWSNRANLSYDYFGNIF